MNKGQRIKSLREKSGLTMEELAKKLGTTKQTIYKYENDIVTNIPSDRMEALSKILQCSPAYIMGWDEGAPSRGVKIPVLGRVAAGIPIEAIENIIDTEEIPEEMARRGEYFGLKVKGTSMQPVICDGDIVIVRKQEDADSDEIVIATVNGDDATCKRLMKYDGGLSLISYNPEFAPMTFTDKQLEEIPVRIIGRVVEERRKF